MEDIQNDPKEQRTCRICKGKLKKFTKQNDWKGRAYHQRCFDEIIRDIAHYNKRAYTKYGHKKRTSFGLTFKEQKEAGPITLTFD